jgi:thioredoxin reductase (NADPH)
MSETQVIVIGGGIGGSAAALRAAQYHLRTAWVLGDSKTAKASRASYVLNIDNMIGVHEGVLKNAMLELLGSSCPEAVDVLRGHHFHIGTQAIIDNVRDRVQEHHADHVDLVAEKATATRRAEGLYHVDTTSGTLTAPYLVLATGVSDRQPRIKKLLPSGKTLDDIHWLFPYANHETILYCIRCEGHLAASVPSAIIGHSPAAGQVALMLHERYATPVTLLTNGERPDLPERTLRLFQAYGIQVRTERLVEVRGPRREGALHGFELESGEPVEARFALVVLGLHRVHNDLAVELGCKLEEGPEPRERHVLVDLHSETTVPDCFAVGDMTTHEDSPIRKQVYTTQEYAVRALDRIDGRVRAARRAAVLQAG